MKALPTTQADTRAFVRMFFSGAVECEPDKQWRITIPPNLRTHAQIDKDLYILGVSTRIEIWASGGLGRIFGASGGILRSFGRKNCWYWDLILYNRMVLNGRNQTPTGDADGSIAVSRPATG